MENIYSYTKDILATMAVGFCFPHIKLLHTCSLTSLFLNMYFFT